MEKHLRETINECLQNNLFKLYLIVFSPGCSSWMTASFCLFFCLGQKDLDDDLWVSGVADFLKITYFT